MILTPQESSFHGARVLAIDDSPTYLESLAESLSADGYEVTRATSGNDGLEIIGRQEFDCVLVDLMMPDMDGIEVCRRARAIAVIAGSGGNGTSGSAAQHNSAAVIMLTARETKTDMTRCLEAGADDFVGKSSDLVVLKARIRALLRRKFLSEENRRIGEQLLRKEFEVTEARAARLLAETRAVLVEELEHKNKELEAFSYSVSHDLRAPLRSIDGFSTVLLEDHWANLDVHGQDCLRRVRAATQRMGELIDDLLRLSRVDRAHLNRSVVNVSALACSVMSELLRANPGRNVQVRIPEGILADADPRLLRVVLENVLGNAWKFTSVASQPMIEIGTTIHEGARVYFVRDNGAGFDMDLVERLFSPFQRLHTDEEFPGTGIGLATVRRIVERHGGRVWAEGAHEKGATFSWTLSPPQRKGQHEADPARHPAGGRQS